LGSWFPGHGHFGVVTCRDIYPQDISPLLTADHQLSDFEHFPSSSANAAKSQGYDASTPEDNLLTFGCLETVKMIPSMIGGNFKSKPRLQSLCYQLEEVTSI
jgi:hypothetical protein